MFYNDKYMVCGGFQSSIFQLTIKLIKYLIAHILNFTRHILYTLLYADIFYGTTKDTAAAEFGFKFGKISLAKLGSG